jgi:hypothetical protein
VIIAEGLRESPSITTASVRKCGMTSDDFVEFLGAFSHKKPQALRKLLVDSKLHKVKVPEDVKLRLFYSEEEELEQQQQQQHLSVL